MKINSIGLYSLNRMQLENSQYKNSQTATSCAPLERPSLGYLSYPVNFTSMRNPIPKEMLQLKELDLPCIYCGGKMISKTVLESLGWLKEPRMQSLPAFLKSLKPIENSLTPEELKIMSRLQEMKCNQQKAPLTSLLQALGYKKSPNFEKLIYKKILPLEYSTETMNLLKKHEDSLLPIEKSVFTKIKAYHNTHPQASLQEIMLALRPKHLASLIRKQGAILNEIDLIAINLSDESKHKVLAVTNQARSIIINNSSEDPFKRKELIEEVKALTDEIPEKKEAQAIKKKILSLPSSINSVSAFIVKYSGDVQVTENKVIIKKLENVILPQEQKIYEEVTQTYSHKGSGEGLEQIIERNKTEHLQKLKESQKTVLEEINTSSQTLCDDFNNTVFAITNATKKELLDPSKDTAVVRQKLLDRIRGLRNVVNEEYLRVLIKKATQMPYPKNNVEALIEKHKESFNVVSTKGKAVQYKLESILSSEESRIFEKLKAKYEGSSKERTLQEEIDEKYPEHLKALADRKIEVLDELDKLAVHLSEGFKKDVLSLTDDPKDIDMAVFSRKIKQLKPLKNKDFKVIPSIASKMPTSENNVSAFIVKYSDFDLSHVQTETKMEQRSDREIVQSLLKNIVVTIEHFRPKEDWILPENGMNEMSNLGLAHEGCNRDRAHTRLHVHLKKHPEIIENAQKQVDLIIDNINDGTLVGLDYYPAGMKKRLFRESKGLIDLDISNLDPNKPKIKAEVVAPTLQKKKPKIADAKQNNQQEDSIAGERARFRTLSKILSWTKLKKNY